MRASTRFGVLSLGLAVALLAGCDGWTDTATDTGILLEVRFEREGTGDSTATRLSGIRFYVAVQQEERDPPVYVLNGAVSGVLIDVEGRDLAADPYRLLVHQNGKMESIRVVVTGERSERIVATGRLVEPDFQEFKAGQIIKRTIWLQPSSGDRQYTWTQTGCLVGTDGELLFGSPEDQDCDGYEAEEFGGEDCNDLDPEIHPGADDQFNCDGKDNDCDGTVDNGGNTDGDGDGVTPCEGDCDDQNGAVAPGMEEVCDGVDNNCNRKCDETFDEDHDGFTTCYTKLVWQDDQEICIFVDHSDCNDQDPSVHPDAEEDCDAADNNCNGLCDEGYDEDHDGYNECGSKGGQEPLLPGLDCHEMVSRLEDCEPYEPSVHPDALERCDGLDNNCDGIWGGVLTECFRWLSPGTNLSCEGGTSQCSESEETWSWGSCTGSGPSVLVPPVHCALWDTCQEHMDPAVCQDQRLETYNLDCDAAMRDGYHNPCYGYPVWPLNIGLANMDSCTWHIMPVAGAANWEVGLISLAPGDTLEPAETVDNCDAALVAFPLPGSTAAEFVDVTISLYADDGLGNERFILITGQVWAAGDCVNFSDSLECSLTPL